MCLLQGLIHTLKFCCFRCVFFFSVSVFILGFMLLQSKNHFSKFIAKVDQLLGSFLFFLVLLDWLNSSVKEFEAPVFFKFCAVWVELIRALDSGVDFRWCFG